MLGSNVEDASEQTYGREDKSRDVVANMEARLANVELAMADTREGLNLIKQGMEKEKVLSMLASMESRIKALATRMESRDQEVSGKWDAKELDNFLWHMEWYFKAIALTNETTKRFVNMEKDIGTIKTWEDFKREIKRQFFLKDVAYLARKNMRRLKHIGSISDYVKEFSSLMLEIPNMTEEKLLFNFMDNLQGWAKQELRLSLWRIDTHAMGAGDEVSRDHNASRMGSGKMPKTLNAMIEEKEQEGETDMGSIQLLGALQVNPKPGTPKTSLLLGVQVKKAKRKQAEIAHTHIDKVTKRKVNLMGKRKQHSKHRKRGNDEDVDDMGGGECQRMLRMSLLMGLYRAQEASGDSYT
ncbi:hypothetical protein AAG906_007650 [Vitis piasezkii]